MRSIEVTLNVGAVAPLLDFIKPIVARLETETAFAADMEEADRELESVWRDGLIHTQMSDCKCFVGLFDREFLDSGRIELNDDNADPVLRAAAAIRLKLRQSALKNIGDEVLASEDFNPDAVTKEERLGFEAFLFLERIQEVILKHLAVE
jgi:hypothetical protein